MDAAARRPGQWVLDHYGPGLRLAGEVRDMRLLAYYAQAEVVPDFDRYSYRDKNLPWTLGQFNPKADVLLLWCPENDKETPRQWRKLLDGHAEWGFCRIPPEQLPASCRDVEELVVAVRKGLGAGPTNSRGARVGRTRSW